EELNQQHGITESKDQVKRENYAFKPKQMKQLIKDRKKERVNQDLTLKPTKIASLGEGLAFDRKRFNQLWDKQIRRKEKAKEIVERTKGPLPFNDATNGTEFTGISENPTLYEENMESTQFGKVNFDDDVPDNNSNEENESDEETADYYEGHNQNRGREYQQTLKERLEERAKDDNEFKNRTFKDFKKEIMYGDTGQNTTSIETLPEYNDDDFAQDDRTRKVYRDLLHSHEKNIPAHKKSMSQSSLSALRSKKKKRDLPPPKNLKYNPNIELDDDVVQQQKEEDQQPTNETEQSAFSRISGGTFSGMAPQPIPSAQDFHSMNTMMNRMAEMQLGASNSTKSKYKGNREMNLDTERLVIMGQTTRSSKSKRNH
ncbi:MAG TPA: hypothetical protein VN704_06640, partial [Verrucomicrobiae bacterium]|nr:hypothetical protein [Verrucomicrobiae bacterium]